MDKTFTTEELAKLAPHSDKLQAYGFCKFLEHFELVKADGTRKSASGKGKPQILYKVSGELLDLLERQKQKLEASDRV